MTKRQKLTAKENMGEDVVMSATILEIPSSDRALKKNVTLKPSQGSKTSKFICVCGT